MAATGLQLRRQRFVEEYVVDFNGAAAASRAGYSPPGTSTAQALLKDPLVQAAITAKVHAMREKTRLTAERVLEELAVVAFSDITELLMWGDEGLHLKPPQDWPVAMRRCVESVSIVMGRGGSRQQVKLYDKLQALDKLAKYFQLFHEDVRLPGVEKTFEELLGWFQRCSDMELRNLQQQLTVNGAHRPSGDARMETD